MTEILYPPSELLRAWERNPSPAFADQALQLPPTEMERELRHAIRPLHCIQYSIL